MFHWLFECQQSSSSDDCVNLKLNNLKAEDVSAINYDSITNLAQRSMFFESFILDHIAHAEFSKYAPTVLALRDQLAAGNIICSVLLFN
jgi:hypothetical protein